MEGKELNVSHISFDDAKKEIAAMNLINGFLFDSATEDENDAKIVVSKILVESSAVSYLILKLSLKKYSTVLTPSIMELGLMLISRKRK